MGKPKQPQVSNKPLTVSDIITKVNTDVRMTHSNANEAIINNMKILTSALMELSEKYLKIEKNDNVQKTTIKSLEAQLSKAKKLKKREK